MLKPIALTTAIAFFAAFQPAPAHAEPAYLVTEQHFIEAGYEVDLYVTAAADGVHTDAMFVDPATGDEVNFWTDGVIIEWSGTVGGEPVSGSRPATVTAGSPPPQAFCAGPIAIVCIGAAFLLSCATTINACPDRETVDPSDPLHDPSNPPSSGGGGDAEEEGDGDGDDGSSDE
jgi:hypothetical protein